MLKLLFLFLVVQSCKATSDPYVIDIDIHYPADTIQGLIENLNDFKQQVVSERNSLVNLSEDVQSFINDNNDEDDDSCKQINGFKSEFVLDVNLLREKMTEQVEMASEMCSDSSQTITDALEMQKNSISESLQRMTDRINIIQAMSSAVASTPLQQTSARPTDCLEAKQLGLPSGVTTVYSEIDGTKDVYCDQDTDGGGWMALIKRQEQEDQLDFQQDVESYETGFGDPSGEYWLGLNFLQSTTNDKPQELLVTMTRGSEQAHSFYGQFRVGTKGSGFKLTVGDYDEWKSTGGDSLTYHNDMKFSSKDNDRDRASGGSCSEWSGGGGWWFNYCYMTNPTGVYGGSKPQTEESDGYLEWRNWQGYYTYLSDFQMLIRPTQ